jgi:osmotically inducible lipoprotein OsmB
MSKCRFFIVVVLLGVFLTGCSNMCPTQQRVLSGGAIGAGAGAAIGVITGGPILTATAIGAGAGAVGGLIYDDIKKRK